MRRGRARKKNKSTVYAGSILKSWISDRRFFDFHASVTDNRSLYYVAGLFVRLSVCLSVCLFTLSPEWMKILCR